MAAAARSVSGGGVRPCERESQRRGRGTGEAGEGRGVRGVCVASSRVSGRDAGRQEVARAAPALATELLRGEGEEDNREEEVGWAGQLRWAARWARTPGKLQVSFCSFIVFLFLFFILCHCFFKFNKSKTVPNIL